MKHLMQALLPFPLRPLVLWPPSPVTLASHYKEVYPEHVNWKGGLGLHHIVVSAGADPETWGGGVME